jgi:hypothetical protein
MRYSAIFLAISVILAGCDRQIQYAVENGSSINLTDILVVSSSGHRFLHGILIPKAHKSFSGGEKIERENWFTITWIDGSGRSKKAEVELSAEELMDRRVRTLRITEAMTLEKRWLLEDRK